MKILVIGDSCDDVFVYGVIERMSPEAPVPVLQPTNKTSNGGMSKNVYNNLKALGVDAFLVTNREEIIKTRYVDAGYNQMVLRVDTNDVCSQIDEALRMNICNNQYQGKTYDAIVISDYCKGFLDESDIESICKSNTNVFLDTKKELGDWISSASFIKINNIEHRHNLKFISNNLVKLKKKLIMTRGKYGCIFDGKTFEVDEVLVRDVSGAGDTFLAGLVVEYLRTNDIVKAIHFAQKCSTIAVQKHGVSVVTKEEIESYE
jgi:D-beta-D-heptose 7-phosphate kinase/D-beta-D-heptose 1-phosphate adenosyltransferase